jgi:ferredoxin hydrogenase small subunit
MAALTAEDKGLAAVMDDFALDLLWHPSLSEASGSACLEQLTAVIDGHLTLDILCIEGSLLMGPDGSGRFHRLAGSDLSVAEVARRLCARARFVVAVGSCAAFGGIPAANAATTGATGLQFSGARKGSGLLPTDWLSAGGLPVINVVGCAPHPGWIVETLAALACGDLAAEDLDDFGRPRFFADHLAHHGCGRNEFYEFKASAKVINHRGCLMENLGCKATQAVGDCSLRNWNGGGSCTNAGAPCIACTMPGFEDPVAPFLETAKVAGIPVGLPVDMPKAWFVALAALSKSATPPRVRQNAESDHVVIPPARRSEDQ